jgi:methionine-rich copper-binding protein CopC
VLSETREVEDPEGTQDAATGVTKPMLDVVSSDLVDAAGQRTRHIETGDEVEFVLAVRALAEVSNPIVSLRIFSQWGHQVYGDSTFGTEIGLLEAGSVTRLVVRLSAELATGSYSADFDVKTADGVVCLQPPPPLSFFVAGRASVWGGAADLHATFEARTQGAESGAPPA